MLKKAALTVLVLLVAFVGILGVRTLMFSSKQMDVDPVPELAVDAAAAAERLAVAVTFKTVSYQDPAAFEADQFEGLNAFLERSFPRVHKTLRLERVNEWSLLYTWEGSDASLDPILLMGHTDVVPVVAESADDWEREPFGGMIHDGFVHGRGTLDDKGNVMAIFEAVELLLAEGAAPKRTVYLAFGHDEEVGGERGAVAIAALLAERGVRAAMVLDEGGAVVSNALPGIEAPVASIGVAEKGYLSVNLTVRTPGGHSSQPPSSTAIGVLSEAVSRLEANQMPGGIGPLVAGMFDYIGPEMPFGMRAMLANLWLTRPLVESQLGGSTLMNAFMRTTTAPTIFQAGVKDNVLPPEATATVNFRILPGDTRESVLAHVTRVVADERVVVEADLGFSSDPSAVSPSEGWAFETIARTVRQTMPEVVVTPYLVVAGTDARHYEGVSEHIYRFSPMALEGDDLARIHGTNERVSVEGYGAMIRYFHRLIMNAAL